MRRGVGITGLQNANQMNASFKETGEALATVQLTQLKTQFETFKTGLTKFAKKYQREIAQNPALRAHFTKMCSKIGVDPLISSKGFWTDILGIGDFYYELAVQIVEICFSLRAETGGLLEMRVLLEKLKRMRNSDAKSSQMITEEDVERSIKTLEPLGSGYQIIRMNSRTFVQSVPREFSQDQGILLKRTSEKGGVVNYKAFEGEWSAERFERVIESLIAEGLVWVDAKTKTREPDYYIASMCAGF